MLLPSSFQFFSCVSENVLFPCLNCNFAIKSRLCFILMWLLLCVEVNATAVSSVYVLSRKSHGDGRGARGSSFGASEVSGI